MLINAAAVEESTAIDYSYSVPIIILFILQGEVHSGYSKHAYWFIDQRLLVPALRQPGYLRQLRAVTSCSSSYIVSYHTLLFELLLIDTHCNCMRIGFEVRACTASSPHVRKKNSFHKLICVIRIFMRKTFVLQCHPQNVFNIELFPNYSGTLTILEISWN